MHRKQQGIWKHNQKSQKDSSKVNRNQKKKCGTCLHDLQMNKKNSMKKRYLPFRVVNI